MPCNTTLQHPAIPLQRPPCNDPVRALQRPCNDLTTTLQTPCKVLQDDADPWHALHNTTLSALRLAVLSWSPLVASWGPLEPLLEPYWAIFLVGPSWGWGEGPPRSPQWNLRA
eukprot:981384-Pyramimonas_sp.AAC.1